MSWEDQGRQYHQWFGHGTAADKDAAPDPAVTRMTGQDRALAVAYGAIAALPAHLRARAEAQYQRDTLPQLKVALTAWVMGTALDRDIFAMRLIGRTADDPVVVAVHAAALAAAMADRHVHLRDAGVHLAAAMQRIGIDRWPGFVADAAERAVAPGTQAAIRASREPPSPEREAIRPVYPIEAALSLGRGVVASGVAAVGRAVAREVAKQIRPTPPDAKLDLAVGAAERSE